MEAYIYTYVNKETGKTYIGSRISYKGKAEDDFNVKYFSSSKNEEFLQDMKEGKLEGAIILKMYGDDTKRKIVEVEHKLIKAYWDKFGRNNSYNHYCNGTFGVNGLHVHKGENYRKGIHLSEETKRKMSLAAMGNKSRTGMCHKPETIEKIRRGNAGKKRTPEQIQKMREIRLGSIPWNKGMRGVVHLSEETKRKISQNSARFFLGKKLSEEHRQKLKKPKKKFKWLTKDRQIVEMDKAKVARWHKDWVLIE